MDAQVKDWKRFDFSWRRLTILVLGCLGLYLGHEWFVNRGIRPPSANCNIAELAEAIPPPARLAVVEKDGLQRLVWIGSIPHLTIRSGPPCYVFNEHGRLIDWCPESGEGWPLDDLAVSAAEAQSISLNEALRWSDR